jgi:lambda family phage minor tail protein L
MAYAAWQASTAYVVGDIVRATTTQASGLVFRCTAAGTSASTQPAWPTDIGSTIVDGGVTWAAISSVYEELAVLGPNAIIELFELQLDTTLHGSSDTYRWHNGCNANVTGNIVWNGNAYIRLPVKAEGFEYTNTGTLPRPTLTISNLDGTMTTLLLLVNATTPGNDLGGATVKRIRTLKKYLDGEAAADPHAKFPDEIWYVDRKASENRDSVSFELASKFDLAGVMIPKRQIIANICQWKYRSTECGYTGSIYFDANDNNVDTLAADVCGKRISSCNQRFGQLVRKGTVAAGSNQLVLTGTVFAVEIGAPIKGFGVPSGTTVSSIVDTTVTMSANATATTSITKSGTIQGNRVDLIVSDTAGLAIGMKVSGPNVPSNATILSIAGTTLTLGQPWDLWDTLVLVDTRSGRLVPQYTRVEVYNRDYYGTDENGNEIFSDYYPVGHETRLEPFTNQLDVTDETSLAVDQYVTGPGIPKSAKAQISSMDGTTLFLNFSTGNSGDTYNNYEFYQVPAFASHNYSFTAPDQNYTFRSASVLPFGSFPSAGLTQ